MTEFQPTHVITIVRAGQREEIPVQLDEQSPGFGPLYTRQEWNAAEAADWELVAGECRFQGQVPVCDWYQIARRGDLDQDPVCAAYKLDAAALVSLDRPDTAPIVPAEILCLSGGPALAFYAEATEAYPDLEELLQSNEVPLYAYQSAPDLAARWNADRADLREICDRIVEELDDEAAAQAIALAFVTREERESAALLAAALL